MQPSSFPDERVVPDVAYSNGIGHRPGLIAAHRDEWLHRAIADRVNAGPGAWSWTLPRTAACVATCAVCYYIATQIAWSLCFPDSKVSLFFPPHAILVAILLLVPTRHWWAYALAAGGAHFLATRQAGWPPLYALTCELFDAVKAVAAAAGIRILIKSPLKALTLRDAIVFVIIAVVLVPFGAAFWGAAFTVSNRFGAHYWIEWRNLGISNAVTTVVLVPAVLLAVHDIFVRRPKTPSRRRALEAALVSAGAVAVGMFVFDRLPAGPNASPALLYAPIPLLIWAALRFGLGGISVVMLIITFQAIWGTMRGHGPFLAQSPTENALALQLFLLVTATPLMLLAVVIDEERRSKEAVYESKEQMGLAAQAANAQMWVWDVSGNDGRITEQGHSLFGFQQDARLDFAAIDCVHPEDRGAREGAIRRALETRGEYEMEYRVLQPDGGIRWINARGRCVEREDGAGLKLFGVSMDVTARKHAEAKASQELEELQRKRAELEHVARVATLGELTATLTHEVRQPLNAILLNASIGIRLVDAPKPDLPQLRDTLFDIRRITQRADEMIQGMRDMLKRETPGFRGIDLNQLIHSVSRIVHSDAVSNKVKVQLDLAQGVVPINGDPVQLQQVMLNLMLNAFSAMGAREPTGVGGRRLIVRTIVNDEPDVLVELQDNGTGIAPDKLESIFEPFITNKPDGLGMGLSICRTIIERHRGKISAVNHPDGGAMFSITLPAARAAATEAPRV